MKADKSESVAVFSQGSEEKLAAASRLEERGKALTHKSDLVLPHSSSVVR